MRECDAWIIGWFHVCGLCLLVFWAHFSGRQEVAESCLRAQGDICVAEHFCGPACQTTLRLEHRSPPNGDSVRVRSSRTDQQEETDNAKESSSQQAGPTAGYRSQNTTDGL